MTKASPYVMLRNGYILNEGATAAVIPFDKEQMAILDVMLPPNASGQVIVYPIFLSQDMLREAIGEHCTNVRPYVASHPP